MRFLVIIVMLLFSLQIQSQNKKVKDTSSTNINLIEGECHIGSNAYDPVYVLDGKIIRAEEFRKIDAKIIESVTVLKDSITKSHFDGQARNGVIIIKTKRRELRKMKKKIVKLGVD